jgi:hypothetical protein
MLGATPPALCPIAARKGLPAGAAKMPKVVRLKL